MWPKLPQDLNTKTREEWRDHVKDRSTQLRIWIQENGEAAALIGFATGIVLVVAFKLVVLLAVLAFLVGYFIWFNAPTSAGDETAKAKQLEDDFSINPPGLDLGDDLVSDEPDIPTARANRPSGAED